MKKLIIAAAIACAAVLSQAATCTWTSGTLKSASSAEGGWSGTTLTSALVTMNVILIDQGTYNGLAGKTQADIYDAYGTATASFQATNAGTTAGTYKGAISYTQNSSPDAVQYAVIIATYHDATYDKDMYIAGTATASYNAGTQKGTAGNVLSSIASSNGGWQSVGEVVPEPTSGLLMLLGMAGLALRRRRA